MYPAPFRSHQPSSRPVPSPAVAGFVPAALAVAVAAAFVQPARTQPSGAQAVHGTVSTSQQGNTQVVTTQNGAGTSHSVVNWQSFSVPAGTITRFDQPSATSTSINRVVGADPSAIFGTLRSNGKLVLVNPAGIAVGAGAVVDTAGFTASTLRMSEVDAIAGRLVFGDGGAVGALTVGGQIVARSGDVVLIAPDVQTAASAVLQSPQGATILAAGRKVELTGRGLEGIRLQVQAPQDRALNLGSLSGDAVGIFAGTLRHSGDASATAVTADGGRVVLKGMEQAEITGSISARRAALGGLIHATAQHVALRRSAVLDASGEYGGGEVLLGGGWQGQDARISNAQSTTAEEGATIKADALQSGNGGTVVLWSDGTTRTSAAISATGGVLAGNGGRVETSGRAFLDVKVAPRVHALAALGRGGDWLLDPFELIIGTGAPAAAATPAPNTYTGNNASSASYIAASTIETALNSGTNVTLKTSGTATAPTQNETRIRVAENITKSAGGAASLTLIAHEDVQVDSNVVISSTSGALNLNFKSGYSEDDGAVSSTGGSVTLGAGSRLETRGGTVSLTGIATAATITEAVQLTQATIDAGSGAVNINGTHASSARRSVLLDQSSVRAGGGISVTTSGTTASIKVDNSTLNATGGNMVITASGSNDNHSVEITGSSLLSGGGAISISGNLTSGGSSTTPAAAGVLISSSEVRTTGSGALTVAGDAGWTSGLARISRGVKLDAGALLQSASGTLTVIGRTGASGSATSMGVEIANGAIVRSTAGNVSISGTLNNPSTLAGHGVWIGGRVESGPAGQITVAGNATVGGGSGHGVQTASTATLQPGTGGLTVTSSVSSSTTATALVSADIGGLINSPGDIAITGTASAPSASGVIGVQTQGSIVASGAAKITITGSGTPAPAPASARDVYIAGVTVSSAGGEILLVGDRMEILSPINSGTGRTVVRPFTTNRAITLAGGDETTVLNLSSTELGLISASTVVVGSSTRTGGITVGALNLPAMTLSLINSASIMQTGALRVAGLKAEANTVTLTNAGNQVGQLSGSSTGAFQFTNAGAGLTVGTVDSTAGVASSASSVRIVNSGSAITLAQGVSGTGGGDSVVLAGSSFTNNAGATAVDAGTGRWLIHSTNPSGDSFGGLDSGNAAVWNTTYGASVTATGDRYVFSVQPTVNVTANAISKVYDGTATFATPTYTSTGLVDASLYGNVFTQDALSGALAVPSAGKNVGSYAITQGTLTGPAGYAFSYTGANAAVTPASVTVKANDQAKVVGQTFAFAGTEFTAIGLAPGESIASATLASAGAPAGAAIGSYPITISGAVGGTGFIAGNYSLSYMDGNMTVGTAPAPAPAGATASQSGSVLEANNYVIRFSQLFRQDFAKDQPQGKDNVVMSGELCRR